MNTNKGMEVKKDGLSQMQSGEWKLTVKVHPNDMAETLMVAPMGTRYMMAMVEIGDDERPIHRDAETKKTGTEGAGEAEPKKRLRDEPRSRQMQKMISVPEFQRFVFEKEGPVHTTPPKEFAGDLRSCAGWRLKRLLGIESSNCLDSAGHALKWDGILTEYEQSTNRMAEQR